MIGKILSILMFLCILGGMFFFVFTSPVDIRPAYERRIDVDSSEKIEWALSNAVHDVESRNFVVTGLSVEKFPLMHCFTIRCSGMDRGAILKLEP